MPASATSAQFAVLNPHVVAGSVALVTGLLSLLVYLYRRRPFIMWWMGAWLILATSMLTGAGQYANVKLGAMVYGISQFLSLIHI